MIDRIVSSLAVLVLAVVVVVVVTTTTDNTVTALSTLPSSTTTGNRLGLPSSSSSSTFSSSGLFAVVASSKKGGPKKGYEPKWTKKTTLADQVGDAKTIGFDQVGLKGTIPVVFRTIRQPPKNKDAPDGEDAPPPIVEEKTSMAWAGQPLRDVASQAGQYIKYGCGKGECGTCECMINGKWVRPCVDVVPAEYAAASASAPGAAPMIVQVKAVKSKASSSGTFFSIRSFIMGFWNNLLGMIGFAKFRRAAKKNWEERQAYEELVRTKTIEKRMARLAREAAAAANGGRGGSSTSGGFARA
jgi:ferredoxin